MLWHIVFECVFFHEFLCVSYISYFYHTDLLILVSAHIIAMGVKTNHAHKHFGKTLLYLKL